MRAKEAWLQNSQVWQMFIFKWRFLCRSRRCCWSRILWFLISLWALAGISFGCPACNSAKTHSSVCLMAVGIHRACIVFFALLHYDHLIGLHVKKFDGSLNAHFKGPFAKLLRLKCYGTIWVFCWQHLLRQIWCLHISWFLALIIFLMPSWL